MTPSRPDSRRLVVAPVVVALMLLAVSGPASPASEPVASRPEEGQITRLYLSVLGRSPESGGFDYWVNRLVEGTGLSNVARFFVSSPEFEERFDAEEDESFIDNVYANVLGRTPDGGGRDYWLGRLAEGLARERLVLFFSESAEFVEASGTGLPELEPFLGRVRAVSAARLGSSWRNGCPVRVEDLRLLEVSHVDFQGRSVVGEIVVHRDVADEVVSVFARLYEARYPIQSLRTIELFGADDERSMAANNSSGFNCRAVTGGSVATGSAWSRHAFGRAIDLNPRQNPYRSGEVVLPPDGRAFLERDRYHPGMIRPGDVVVRAFADAGWAWGGRWTSVIDYQHFEAG